MPVQTPRIGTAYTRGTNYSTSNDFIQEVHNYFNTIDTANNWEVADVDSLNWNWVSLKPKTGNAVDDRLLLAVNTASHTLAAVNFPAAAPSTSTANVYALYAEDAGSAPNDMTAGLAFGLVAADVQSYFRKCFLANSQTLNTTMQTIDSEEGLILTMTASNARGGLVCGRMMTNSAGQYLSMLGTVDGNWASSMWSTGDNPFHYTYVTTDSSPALQVRKNEWIGAERPIYYNNTQRYKDLSGGGYFYPVLITSAVTDTAIGNLRQIKVGFQHGGTFLIKNDIGDDLAIGIGSHPTLLQDTMYFMFEE